MKKKSLLAVLFLALFTFVLAACTSDDKEGSTDVSKEEGKLDTVKIGLLKSLSNSSIYLGDEQGIFKKHGIAIEYIPFQSAQPIAVAAQTGDIDVGSTALTAGFFNLLAKDSSIRLVADSGRENPDHGLTALVVSNEAYANGITNIEDLKGKKLGISQTGSSQHFTAGQLLESAGLSINDVELVPLGGVSNIAAALESNQVDAGLLLSTVGTPLLDQEKVKLVTWVGDVVEMQTTSVFYSKKMMENEELAERFLTAYIEAVHYYQDNVLNATDTESDAFKSAITVLASQTGISEELVAGNLTYLDRDATVWKENMSTWIQWFGDNGLLTGDVDVEKIIAEDLHENALSNIQ